jgi:hypothetical protein
MATVLDLSHVCTGTREYLESEVLPHVHAALAALLHKMQEERLQVCVVVSAHPVQQLFMLTSSSDP